MSVRKSQNASFSCFTLLQHSGYTEGEDGRFKQAVEESPVNPDRLGDIHRAGGLIFQRYDEARDRGHSENYSLGNTGLIPKVKGSFKHVRGVGMVFVPERK